MTRTYADGYGNWHAVIPITARVPELLAHEAIACELSMRGDATIENCKRRMTVYEIGRTADAVAYAERWPNDCQGKGTRTMQQLPHANTLHATARRFMVQLEAEYPSLVGTVQARNRLFDRLTYGLDRITSADRATLRPVLDRWAPHN